MLMVVNITFLMNGQIQVNDKVGDDFQGKIAQKIFFLELNISWPLFSRHQKNFIFRPSLQNLWLFSKFIVAN